MIRWRSRLFLLSLACMASLGSAAERILFLRFAPTQATLFVSNADGSGEHPITPPESLNYNGAPSAGTVRWTQHGWAVALAFASGYVYTDAVITDNGCALIGIAEDYSCAIVILAPTHIRFTLKQGTVTRRIGDIELTGKDTTRTVHQVIPETGKPYTETTIWVRDSG
jgi:hypothetical protein